MTADLSSLNVPGPTITALTAPFWEAAEKGRLLVQRCEACGEALFYPRAQCPHCWSPHLKWQEVSGRGRLKSFSVVHRPGHPGWLPITPYTVGLVTLEEGPIMLSFILPGDAAEHHVGERLVLAPTRIGSRLIPAFRPEASKKETR